MVETSSMVWRSVEQNYYEASKTTANP